MGTRCTAGGEDAGDIPKKRFNSSLNGSAEPNDPPNGIDMTPPGARGGSKSGRELGLRAVCEGWEGPA
ncbi:hypothetical protein GCM10018980_13630 [Streptomyces capoamus]|uniref:Uncharacterized protein n=1 Tax=Streptomyces capoamus TaxID=68183 RepID=A0A919C1C0_9ACTN|nr:hypothetical protein GCM10018980_13630 [Streptomyces capoamus]